MAAERNAERVLIVSSGDKGEEFFRGALSAEFSTEIVKSGAEARRILANSERDVIVINCPLKDEYGTDLAEEAVKDSFAGVVLLVKSEAWDAVSFGMEKIGVHCIAKPLSSLAFLGGVRLAAATSQRLKGFAKKTENLMGKMEEIKLVGRAKLLLMQKLSLTEEEAHKYIEKQAMDRCVKRAVVARDVIKTYSE